MTSPMPAIFFGHGNPMNAIQSNSFTEAWAESGRSVPTPEAVLCISAHWYIPGIAVTAMERPKTILDFGGFPRELFGVEYPALGRRSTDPGRAIYQARSVHSIGNDGCYLLDGTRSRWIPAEGQ